VPLHGVLALEVRDPRAPVGARHGAVDDVPDAGRDGGVDEVRPVAYLRGGSPDDEGRGHEERGLGAPHRPFQGRRVVEVARPQLGSRGTQRGCGGGVRVAEERADTVAAPEQVPGQGSPLCPGRTGDSDDSGVRHDGGSEGGHG
jgi:hypothetical protein